MHRSFFLSLEDTLFRVFGGDKIKNMMVMFRCVARCDLVLFLCGVVCCSLPHRLLQQLVAPLDVRMY